MSIKINLSEIQYDLDGQLGYHTYDKTTTSGLTREEQLKKLPKTSRFEFDSVVDFLDDDNFNLEHYRSLNKSKITVSPNQLDIKIRKLVEDETSWLCMGCNYTIEVKIETAQEEMNGGDLVHNFTEKMGDSYSFKGKFKELSMRDDLRYFSPNYLKYLDRMYEINGYKMSDEEYKKYLKDNPDCIINKDFRALDIKYREELMKSGCDLDKVSALR